VNRNFFGFKGIRAASARFWVLAAVIAAGCAAPSFAQNDYAVGLAQQAVRERIVREHGGNASSVNFPSRWPAETFATSGNQTGVRGQGTYRRDGSTRGQRFTYEAFVNTRNGRVQRVSYNFTGDDDSSDNDRDDRDDRVPRWLVGTFRGRSPAGRQGQFVTVTIGRGGDVLAVYDNGPRESGNYMNGQIQLSGRTTWDVSRANNGFRATSRRRSEDFVRTGGGGAYEGGDADVPSWMVGTFRGSTNSGESELTIRSDGSATIRSLRSNETFYGRYYDRLLRFDWGEFEVQRERDGLRTTEVSNRINQTYYRRARN
jgi:hypothetical protein